MAKELNCILQFTDEEFFKHKPPALPDYAKEEIRNLMNQYFDKKSLFVYEGNSRRESYAYPKTRATGIEGCLNKNGKYYINCGLLAQMIWMGRSIYDFMTEKPTTEITNVYSDWGYYFDFLAAQTSYGVMKNETTYYGSNTYIDDNGNTKFVTFDNAAAMGMELFYKGYEIPYSQVDIGDLVFYRTENEVDGDTDNLEQTSFRNITHVAIVCDIDEDGIPVLLESSNAYTAGIGKASLSPKAVTSTFSKIRGAHLTTRVCMAARHPLAWGKGNNVPAEFTTYRHK